jgi:hypothetical protein
MFNALCEVSDPSLLRLTSIQKGVLLTIQMAQTPRLAYDATTMNLYTATARDFLMHTSLIRVYDMGAVVTSNGNSALESNGLIDGMGELTELGTTLATEFAADMHEVRESLVPFRVIRSLCN